MSRRWMRATVATTCGSCGRRVYDGQPLFILEGIGWKKYRCQDCAGEPVALEAPPVVTKPARVEETTAATMQRLTGAYQPALGIDVDGEGSH